jgi:uncharacterized protein (DUF2147 family)
MRVTCLSIRPTATLWRNLRLRGAAATGLLLAATAIIGSHQAQAQGSVPIAGRWRTDDGNAIVTIAPCGNAHCGRITQLTRQQPAGGARDGNNPNPALRSRPIVGLTIFSNLQRNGNSWRGTGYMPQAGRNFQATLTPAGNRLTVRGCVSVFCQSMDWTRAD